MASTKLTKHMREQICRAVMKHRFAESVEQLRADYAAFADEVYNDVYRKADREKMAALPKGWLPTQCSVRVQFGTSYESLSFNGRDALPYESRQCVESKTERVERAVIAKHERSAMKAYGATHRLSQKYETLAARKADLDKQIREVKAQTEGALYSASTINRLIEMWPEIEPFAKGFEAKPQALPAVPTDKLNKLLDLPVSATA